MHFLNLATTALIATVSALPNSETTSSLVTVRYDPEGAMSIKDGHFKAMNRAHDIIDQDDPLMALDSLPTFQYDLKGELKELGYQRFQSFAADGTPLDMAVASKTVLDRYEEMKARKLALMNTGTSVNEARDVLNRRYDCVEIPCDDDDADCAFYRCGECDPGGFKVCVGPRT